MDFGRSISTCLSKYATFSGRASRSEYWWFVLFTILVSSVAQILDALLAVSIGIAGLDLIATFALLIPSIAVAARRLHDTDRSGWWQLLLLIPLVGWIVLLVWYCTRGTVGPNRFGADPLPSPAALAGVHPAA
jgi:uncharacterized membrane protein YhaH (DUF805 family)